MQALRRDDTSVAALARRLGVDWSVEHLEHAALDPFRGYLNAVRAELNDAAAVLDVFHLDVFHLDAFHVVQLGTKVVDEVWRRVQQATLGHRGHRDDALYKIRGLLRHGIENLTDRQLASVLMESTIGLCKTELIKKWAPWKTLADVELATAEYIDWFNTRRQRTFRVNVYSYFWTTPAALKHRPPSSATVRSTTRWQLPSSARSPRIVTHRFPALPTSSAVCAASSSSCSDRYAMATSALSLANATATARAAMPESPPVTRARAPASRPRPS